MWFLSQASLMRAFDLMDQYRARPMDLADASIVAAAEAMRTTLVLTIDRADFSAYKARVGRSHRAFRQV